MALAAVGTLFICGGIQGYQAGVGDLRRAGALEWPIRVLLVIGGFVLATPGGGISPLAQWQMTGLGLAILVPTAALALFFVRRGVPAPVRGSTLTIRFTASKPGLPGYVIRPLVQRRSAGWLRSVSRARELPSRATGNLQPKQPGWLVRWLTTSATNPHRPMSARNASAGC